MCKKIIIVIIFYSHRKGLIKKIPCFFKIGSYEKNNIALNLLFSCTVFKSCLYLLPLDLIPSGIQPVLSLIQRINMSCLGPPGYCLTSSRLEPEPPNS